MACHFLARKKKKKITLISKDCQGGCSLGIFTPSHCLEKQATDWVFRLSLCLIYVCRFFFFLVVAVVIVKDAQGPCAPACCSLQQCLRDMETCSPFLSPRGGLWKGTLSAGCPQNIWHLVHLRGHESGRVCIPCGHTRTHLARNRKSTCCMRPLRFRGVWACVCVCIYV